MAAEPLAIPLSPADRERLAAVVAREWSGDRGVASLAGVDPERVTAKLLPVDGTLVVNWQVGQEDAIRCALRDLAEALEGLGYAVDWSGGGPRVVGWAATRWATGPGSIVKLIDLERECPWTEPVKKWRDALFAAREARRGPGAVDAKRAGAMQRDAAAYPRGKT